MGFGSKREFAPPTILLGLLLCPCAWGYLLTVTPEPAILLGFLWPWTLGISSRPLQAVQPTLAAPVPCRLPCPSPTPRAYSNSCPLSRWYHPTISSSVIPFSSCLQSFLASGSFPMSQFFTSGGQNTGVSASELILQMNIQELFSLEWTGWTPCRPRDSRESFPTPQFKSINSLALSFLYSSTLTSIHDYWKNHSFDYIDLHQQSHVCLCFLIMINLHCLCLS